MEIKRRCFKCKTDYAPEVKICIRCGVNLDTGLEIGTLTGEIAEGPPPEPAELMEEEEAPPTLTRRVLNIIAYWMPGLFRPVVMIASLLLSLLALGLIVLCLVLFDLGGWISAFPIGGLGLVAYGQAVIWMMSGDFRLIHDAALDFESQHWTFFFTLFLLPLFLGVLFMKYAASYISF